MEPEVEASEDLPVYSSFEAMGLREELLRGVLAYGFERPSAVQQRAIMPIIQGRNVIVQSQSGTGKTAVFTLAALQTIRTDLRQPQVLVLNPTRELSEQTQRVAKNFGKYMKVAVHSCIGGTSVSGDIQALEGGAHLVTGTPGRVMEMILKKALVTTGIRMLVLDEADEMLEPSFKGAVREIHHRLPSLKQVVIVSATLPGVVLELAVLFMENPVKVLVRRDELTLQEIKQYYVNVNQEEHKFETLCDIYDQNTIAQSVVFCNSVEKADWLAKRLLKNHFTVSCMHGRMPQKERDKVMADFLHGRTRLLVATDLWGRGLDVQQVTLVFNYDLPANRELYIHRIGRSGRFGRHGVAINLVTDGDIRRLQNFEQFYGTQIQEMPASIEDLV